MRTVGLMFARFVALAMLLLGAWIFVINSIERGYDEPWVFLWVVFSGLVGAVGGTLYLLSIDGPERLRTRSWRMWGWGGMMASALLPHSFSFIVIPLVIALVPTLFTFGTQTETPITSS